jgi:hypothetical protein
LAEEKNIFFAKKALTKFLGLDINTACCQGGSGEQKKAVSG